MNEFLKKLKEYEPLPTTFGFGCEVKYQLVARFKVNPVGSIADSYGFIVLWDIMTNETEFDDYVSARGCLVDWLNTDSNNMLEWRIQKVLRTVIYETIYCDKNGDEI